MSQTTGPPKSQPSTSLRPSISNRENRPMTSNRPTTAISTRPDNNVILCIAEGRGPIPEIGTAYINLRTSECGMCQFSDSSNYPLTFHKLFTLEPFKVLISETCLDPPSKLIQAIGSHLTQHSEVVSTPRKAFNEQTGIEILQKYSLKGESLTVLHGAESKYFALSALAAIFHYLDSTKNIVFKNNSVVFQYQSVDGTMFIDPKSARQLELVTNGIDSKSKFTLLGVLNKTKTAMGLRLLRASILQPLKEKNDILKRQNAVAELLAKPEMIAKLGIALDKFPDLDHLISSLIQMPKKEVSKYSEQSINRIILLKQILKQTQTVADALDLLDCDLLMNIQKVVNHVEIETILAEIDLVISEDIMFQKGTLGLRNQKSNAVKSGYNGLLDVARQTYKESTDDVHELVDDYIKTFGINLKLNFSSSAGYFLSTTPEQLGDEVLPDEFINVSRKKNQLTFTSLKLLSQNEKINQSLNEIYIMSEKLIAALMLYAHEKLPILYKVAESIAILDLVLSLAVVANSDEYVQPTFSDTLAIQKGRHPILEKDKKFAIVANDSFADETVRMQIITGPNMSGKTVYINQIALIILMAQIGSFVPASFASIRITDKLLTRIGHDDGAVAEMSTFTQEMKEAAFILNHFTDNSVVIIDELGRGTSTADGTSVAIAICEELLKKKAFVFFVTHFAKICSVFEDNPVVGLLHLQVSESAQHILKYEYKLKNGQCAVENYGIDLSRQVGFPPNVIDLAVAISTKLENTWAERETSNKLYQLAQQSRRDISLAMKLIQVMRNSSLDEKHLREYLVLLRQGDFMETE